MALPGNMSLVWVRGTFLNLDGSAMTGRITFSANVIGGALVNPTAKRIIGASPFSGTLDSNTGYFQVQLPATNDPDVTPVGFTYSVVEPTGRKYSITVPFDAPALDSPGDPLHGQQVIELSDIVPAPGASGGTAQLLRGRGVASMDVDGANHLVVTYSDATTEDLGALPGGALANMSDLDTTGAAVGDLVAVGQVSGGNPTQFRTSALWRNARFYGAVGDGTADDTAAMQAAINAAVDGDTVLVPPGRYRLTAPLVIDKRITLAGAGIHDIYKSLTSGGSSNQPIDSPYMVGTVFEQTTAGVDGIQVTGSGRATHLRDFGVRFVGAHMLTNTGHGINAAPTQTYNGRLDHGIFHAEWDNLSVFGHDGNHYGFRLVNSLYCSFSHLRCFGGGGLEVWANSTQINYGNLTVEHLYASVVVGGTAHGIYAHAASGTPASSGGELGILTFLEFTRPQVAVQMVPAFAASVANPPTAAQRTASFGEQGWVFHYSIVAPDFEAPVIPCQAVFAGGQRFVDPTGQIDNTVMPPAANVPWISQSVGATGMPGAVAQTRLAGRTAKTPPVSGTWEMGDVVTTTDGGVWVCTEAGTPGVWARVRDDVDMQTTGEETRPREWATASGTAHPGTGILWLTYFTARKTETCANVRVAGGNPAAAATPTLIRIGMYEVNADNSLTLVASTANDTTLWSGQHQSTTKAWTAPFTKVAGKRYAVGVLIVSAAAMPAFWGAAGSSGELGREPKVCSQVSSLADLPSTVTAGAQSNSTPGRWFLATVTP